MSRAIIQEFQDHVTGFKNSKLSKSEAICNWTLGFVGETGEVLECIKNYVDAQFQDDPYDMELLKKEVGDLFWYLFALTDEIGIPVTEIIDMAIELENDKNNFSTDPVRYDLNFLEQLEYWAVAMTIYSLKAADHIKKCEFHGKGFSDLSKIKSTLSTFLWYLYLIMDDLDLDFDEILQLNIDKLTKRHEGKSFNIEAANINKAKGG